MNKFLPVLSIIGALIFSSVGMAKAVAPPAPVQWTVASGGNGHWYQLVDTSMTLSDAETYADNLEWYLATITSQEENDSSCIHWPPLHYM